MRGTPYTLRLTRLARLAVHLLHGLAVAWLLFPRLSEAERKGVNLVKDEFGGAWNSFVADLDLLELRLQDARAQGKV